MHELSVCQALIDQVESVARAHDAARVLHIVVKMGPLSGVEAELLRQAYPIASAGTLADGAELMIEASPLIVRCNSCGAETEAAPNRLLCHACGDWHIRIVSGDELILANIELERQGRE